MVVSSWAVVSMFHGPVEVRLSLRGLALARARGDTAANEFAEEQYYCCPSLVVAFRYS